MWVSQREEGLQGNVGRVCVCACVVRRVMARGWWGGGWEGVVCRGTFSWFPMSLRAASMRAENGCSAATPSATIVVGDALSRCASNHKQQGKCAI